MRLSPGTQLGQYRIVEPIGAGGMGEVYRARDTKLDRTVALKILPPELAESEERRTRFLREAKAASAIDHPNVAHIYEIGEADGIHFIAMQYVDGANLAARVKGDTLATADIINIGLQTRTHWMRLMRRASSIEISNQPTWCSPRAIRSKFSTSASRNTGPRRRR